MPARRGAWAIYEVFKTAGDGQLFIGVTSDQQWARFVEEFGLQELAADPRLATNVMRLAERAWLIPALQEVLAALPQDEVAQRCERANVSWAPVGQPGDLFDRRASAGDRRAARRLHLALRRRGRQKVGSAGAADRVRRRPPAPGVTPPAAAHGRAQRRSARRGRIFGSGNRRPHVKRRGRLAELRSEWPAPFTQRRASAGLAKRPARAPRSARRNWRGSGDIPPRAAPLPRDEIRSRAAGSRSKWPVIVAPPDETRAEPMRADCADARGDVADPEPDAAMVRPVRRRAVAAQRVVQRETAGRQCHRDRLALVERLDDRLAAAVDAVRQV